ncbi:MAG: hypothetical protein ACR2FZ_06945 [Thermoleophilaceae bacterium]
MPPETRRVLLVANRTAMTAALRAEVEKRAAKGPVTFHLLVPAHPHGLHRVVDPEVAGREEAQARMEEALVSLAEASGSPVTGEVGDADPIAAIQDAMNSESFDEIVISTLPKRVSRWLHLDLPSKARGLGLPVTHIESMPSGESVAA